MFSKPVRCVGCEISRYDVQYLSMHQKSGRNLHFLRKSYNCKFVFLCFVLIVYFLFVFGI